MEGQLLLSLNNEMRILSYKNIVWTIDRLVRVGPKHKTLWQFCFSALMPNNFSALAKGRQLCTWLKIADICFRQSFGKQLSIHGHKYDEIHLRARLVGFVNRLYLEIIIEFNRIEIYISILFVIVQG